MSTIAQTKPRPGRNFNLRAFLGGGTATTALIAAAVVVFSSLAAYVAFNGVPIGGSDEDSSSITVRIEAAVLMFA